MAEIATLEGISEGLGRVRSCLAVKRGKDGACRCARFGPPSESAPKFSDLCTAAGLGIKIGKQVLGGLPMSSIDEIEDIEGLEDSGGLAGFLGLEGPFLDPEMLKSSAKVAVGGALAATAYGLITAKVTTEGKNAEGVTVQLPWFDAIWKKVALGAGLGFLSGRLLWDRERDIAKGIVGAMGGVIAIEAIRNITLSSTDNKHLLSGGAFGALGATAEDVDLLSGLGQGGDENSNEDADVEAEAAIESLPEEQALLGLGETSVSQEQQHLFGEVSMEERSPELADVGSWIS